MSRPDGKIAALVMASGKLKPDMASVAGGATNRALIALHGRPMLDYVLDALRAGLRQAGQADARILVAGDVPLPVGCVAVEGGASLVDTLLSGASALHPDETRLLVVTSDIPFLTPDAVADVVQRAHEAGEAEFVYPLIDADVCRRAYPDMRRTTLKVADGEFTGGNVALLDPAFLRDKEALLRAAYARRKSVVGLAGLLGVGTLLRLIGSRVVPSLFSIRHGEAAVGRALGARARAIVTPFPEIGADVDRPEDVALALKYLPHPVK